MLTVTLTGANIDFPGLRSLFFKSHVQETRGGGGSLVGSNLSVVVVHFTFSAFSFTVERVQLRLLEKHFKDHTEEARLHVTSVRH